MGHFGKYKMYSQVPPGRVNDFDAPAALLNRIAARQLCRIHPEYGCKYIQDIAGLPEVLYDRLSLRRRWWWYYR